MLDAKLTELESAGDDKRFEDEREELSSRLAEVHTRLSDMDAESGPARAAALLAGVFWTLLIGSYDEPLLGLGFDEADQHRPTKAFSGGWR